MSSVKTNALNAQPEVYDADEANSSLVPNGNGQRDIIAHKCCSYNITSPTNIVRQSWYLAIGAVGIFSAYSGVMSLQSSLNFDESIGTTSLAICFGTTIFFNVTLVPMLLQSLGAKVLLLVSDFTFVLFTLANLFPVKYILYPAAMVLGIGEAFVWPAITMFNAQFAESFVRSSSESTEKTKNYRRLVTAKTRWFTARFFAVFSSYLILGSLLAYAILVIDVSPTEEISRSNATEGLHVNLSHPSNTTECGASDCYEYDSEESKDKLGVSSSFLRYILFASYALLQICSLIFHKVMLTDPSGSSRDGPLSFKSLFAFQVKIVRHVTSPLQLLIIPLNVYSGMMIAFIFGELTRSYIACTLGVEQVGLAMAIFGVTGAIGSLLFQWSSKFLGKNCFAGLFFAMEAALLVFCRIWKPPVDEESAWQIYMTAAAFGFPDSIRQAVICATYPEYFSKKSSVAYSVLSMLTASGIAIMFAIGTSICVYMKITTLLLLLAISVTCYIVGEIYFRRIKSKE